MKLAAGSLPIKVLKSKRITASARKDRKPVILRDGIVKSKAWQNKRQSQNNIPKEKHQIGTSGNNSSVDMKMAMAKPKYSLNNKLLMLNPEA